MASGRARKWGLIGLVVLLILIVGGIVGVRVGIGILKGMVVEALGPDSEITEIRVGWSSVEVEGLRIKGQKGWPSGASPCRMGWLIVAARVAAALAQAEPDPASEPPNPSVQRTRLRKPLHLNR
jgi:hypothetical protein